MKLKFNNRYNKYRGKPKETTPKCYLINYNNLKY